MKEYKKLIITILISVIAVVSIIMLKNMVSYKLPNESMGVRSVISRGHVDTLFVGSSAYRKGINMYMVEEMLPGESFMLTYNGNQPFNMAIELRELIAGGADIDTLVVDFNPSMADRGADLSDKRLLWDISMDGKKNLWKELAKREDAGIFTWFDYWVSSNMDYAVTYMVAKPMISQRYYLGGSSSLDESEGKTASELEELEIIENPGINELQMRSVDEIIALCHDNNINLIFLECPRYITMADNENYKAKSDELRLHIEEQDVCVITGAYMGFDNKNPEYYADLTHMSGDGGRVLTEMIINVLKEQ